MLYDFEIFLKVMMRTVENDYILKVDKLPGMCLQNEGETGNVNSDSIIF